jgi:photosystem II stability/assembly factor-like uncharacterized protein
MKKSIRYSFLGALFALSLGLILFNSSDSEKDYYQVRESEKENEGYYEEEGDARMIGEAMKYLAKMRANQITGVVDPADVQKARELINSHGGKLHKARLPLVWRESGPDNFGGRTRAFLIDRNDNQTLFAGGVSGGLWKSTNGGNSWYKINDQQENLAVVSITQGIDGAIYYGTGEGAIPFNNANAIEGTFIQGEGVFKSTDGGETFTQLPSTRNFVSVLDMVSHPTENLIFMGNELGLYYSDNGGDNWTKITSILGAVTELKMDPNGTLFVNTRGRVFRSENPEDNGSYEDVLTVPNVNRMELAIAHSDINYVYAVASLTTNLFGGLYRSTDNGKTWELIQQGGSEFFTPLSSALSAQGGFNLCLGVDPRNKDRVFIGGVDFAEWTPEKGAHEVASLFQSATNAFYIHADKHEITFDVTTDPPIMYVSTDGGTFKTTDGSLSRYRQINNGYSTIQYYGIAGGRTGIVLAGSQDQGTHYINKQGSTPQQGIEVLGGDGFRSEISKFNDNIFFMETYFGGIYRSANRGRNNAQFFNADSRIPTRARGSAFDLNSDFNTEFTLWEQDENTSRFFVSAPTGIWMATNPTNFNEPPTWFRISSGNSTYHNIDVSKDGDHVFAGRSGEVLRVSGLNKAIFTVDALPIDDQISDSLEQVNITTNLPRGRFITDVEVDQNDPNRVIVTLGNYGNTQHIFMTENALDDNPTWRSIQGAGANGIPPFPIYDAEFSESPGQQNVVIVGTEFGIWATSNVAASNPIWSEANDAVDLDGSDSKFPRVPVYELDQVSEDPSQSVNMLLYAGTHGRGAWETGWRLSSVNQTSKLKTAVLNTYPNPATQGQATVSVVTEDATDLNIQVANLNGQIVYTGKLRSAASNETFIKLNTSDWANGTYVISVKGANYSGHSRLMVLN